jgi:hypothetical protein
LLPPGEQSIDVKRRFGNPALRQAPPIAVPSSTCREMKAICVSENFDLFMILPSPTAVMGHAANLEFSGKDRLE